MAEKTSCMVCDRPIVVAEREVLAHAPELLHTLEEILEEFEDHQFKRARAVVARAKGEPEELAIRKFDATLKTLSAQDWDGAEDAIADVSCWLDMPGAYVPAASIERPREALREPSRPSYDQLLTRAGDVALGNTEYDTLSSLAGKLIKGSAYGNGANNDDDQDE